VGIRQPGPAESSTIICDPNGASTIGATRIDFVVGRDLGHSRGPMGNQQGRRRKRYAFCSAVWNRLLRSTSDTIANGQLSVSKQSVNMSIRTVDYRDSNAGQEFVRSLHETGFAVLKNHPVSGSMLDGIYKGWGDFFNSEEKQDFLYDPENRDATQQGYHPSEMAETAVGHTVQDLKEYFHVVPGGRIPAALETDILGYRNSAFEVGEKLAGWLQRYTPQNAIAAMSESFTEMLTILPVAKQPGLQVKDTADNWVDVASVRGELVLNSGDMLKELTGGYFPSTTHRVVNPVGDSDFENVSRISIPFFLTPRLDVVLSDRYTCGSYLEERLSLITH
jgi:isopenicillin N synthase-like dioxygenase